MILKKKRLAIEYSDIILISFTNMLIMNIYLGKTTKLTFRFRITDRSNKRLDYKHIK